MSYSPHQPCPVCQGSGCVVPSSLSCHLWHERSKWPEGLGTHYALQICSWQGCRQTRNSPLWAKTHFALVSWEAFWTENVRIDCYDLCLRQRTIHGEIEQVVVIFLDYKSIREFAFDSRSFQYLSAAITYLEIKAKPQVLLKTKHRTPIITELTLRDSPLQSKPRRRQIGSSIRRWVRKWKENQEGNRSFLLPPHLTQYTRLPSFHTWHCAGWVGKQPNILFPGISHLCAEYRKSMSKII